MDLDEYTARYHGFVESTAQARIVTLLAAEQFRGFPGRLPPATQAGLEDLFSLLRHAAEQLPGPQVPAPAPPPLSAPLNPDDPFLVPTLSVLASRVLRGEPLQDLDASFMASGLELAHYIAALSAFLGDTLRAICLRRPQQLAQGKKITWESVVGTGSWEALIELLIDEYLQELGMLSLVKALSLLETKCGLVLARTTDELALLDEAEERRHLLLHNGGRVNRRYLNRFPECGLPLQSVVPLGPDYTRALLSCIQATGSAVFGATATKFFGATERHHQIRFERPAGSDA